VRVAIKMTKRKSCSKRLTKEEVLQQLFADDSDTDNDVNEDDVEFDVDAVDTADDTANDTAHEAVAADNTAALRGHLSETEQSDAESEATIEYDFRAAARELDKPPDWRVLHSSEYNADTIQVGQFTSDHGPTNPLPADAHPVHYFHQLCEGFHAVAGGKDLFDVFAFETNRYAEKYVSEHQDTMKAFAKARKWEPTSREEMRAFVGLLLNIGLVCKPTIDSYFCEKYFSQQTPGFKIMSLDRFKLLLRFFHVSDFERNHHVHLHHMIHCSSFEMF